MTLMFTEAYSEDQTGVTTITTPPYQPVHHPKDQLRNHICASIQHQMDQVVSTLSYLLLLLQAQELWAPLLPS